MGATSIFAQDSGGGSPASLLIFLLIPVVMYFLMIRPQRKRVKAQAALQSSIGIGDEVVTNSGIYGFITGVEGDRFWLEIDDDVQIRIARAAIQGKVHPGSDSSSEPSDGDADKDADKDADRNADKTARSTKGAKRVQPETTDDSDQS